jgi:Permuted papain-like amidase enzyme, YaeF/YiiX, C92 family
MCGTAGAKVAPEDFPQTVRQFLAESDLHLRTGDIVLSRSRTFTSWLIRYATGSQFSHAALVFLVAKPEEGFNNTFLLESVSSGVGLANLRDYIGGRRATSDIAILRLEGEGLDESYFKKVRGLMLDHVRSGYDYGRVMRLGLSAAFGMRLGWFKLKGGERSSMRNAVVRTRRRLIRWVPPQFICSGFIQYGLLKAAEIEGLATPVTLKAGLSPTDRDGILAVSPEDVARSERLTWLFVARRGYVRRVAGYAEAVRLISSGR